MTDIITNIIEGIANSFDFTYCVIVNIIAYFINSTIIYFKHKNINTWLKRIVLVGVSIIIGIIYIIQGKDTQIIFNSCILAPVSWSWIFKPICNKFHIDYKDFLNDKE